MARRATILLCVILAFSAGVIRVIGHRAHAADPNALWKIVHERCVPNAQLHNNPKPCLSVDLNAGEAKGYTVLKDIRGVAQLLLIPTRRLSGIESPAILAPDAPNYWQEAWAARRLMKPYMIKPLPDDDIALAINSREGRSQNQLHIHIDCIRADVKKALNEHQTNVTMLWAEFPVALAGHTYRAMRINGADLADHDLFKLLAQTTPEARVDMGAETLAAIGTIFADGTKGFYVLNDHFQQETHDRASSEQILDHDCALAR